MASLNGNWATRLRTNSVSPTFTLDTASTAQSVISMRTRCTSSNARIHQQFTSVARALQHSMVADAGARLLQESHRRRALVGNFYVARAQCCIAPDRSASANRPTSLPKTLTLSSGWTFLPCPYQSSVPLADFAPVFSWGVADQFKSQSRFAEYCAL